MLGNTLIWVVLIGISPSSAESDKIQESEALLARARALADIRCEGCPSFQLKTRFRLVNVPNGPLEGSYNEFHHSPRQWRRVLQIPEWKYQAVEIREGDRIFRAAGSQYEPYFEFRLKHLLGGASELDELPRGENLSIKRKNISGRSLACITRKGKKGKSEFCFESDSGALASIKSGSGDYKNTYEYLHYVPHGEKQFPFHMRQKEQETVFLEVEVNELSVNTGLGPSLFVPPHNAGSWAHCDEPTKPEPIAVPGPRYPRDAWRARHSGKVVIYIVVGPDGRVHNATPVRAEYLSLAKASLDTIERHWLFKPAACGDNPVPLSIFVETEFHLLRR